MTANANVSVGGTLGGTGSLEAILKRLYPQSEIENLVYKNNPFLSMVPKAGTMLGEFTAIATQFADVAGRSATFAQAQSGAVATASRQIQFLLNRTSDYSLFQITEEAILAGSTSRAAIVNTLETQMNSALNAFGRSRSISLFGDGTGARGQVSVSGTTFTMLNKSDIVGIEVGQVIVASNGATKTAILRNSGIGQTVISVNRSAGSFVVDANTDTVTTNDWVFIKGDRQVAAITSQSQMLLLSGLEAWNPATDPTSALFFNVDRSADTQRLGGIRINISAQNPEEGLIAAMSEVALNGAMPSHLFVNHVDFANIQKSLGAKVQTKYTERNGSDIGWSTIDVTGPTGDVKVVPDRDCPVGVGRLLQLDTWKLHYAKDLAHMQDRDGAFLSRVYNADAYEGRISFYGQLACTAPGYNARLVMP